MDEDFGEPEGKCYWDWQAVPCIFFMLTAIQTFSGLLKEGCELRTGTQTGYKHCTVLPRAS